MAGVKLHDLLRFWARRWRDRTAVKCADGAAISWDELDRRSDRIAAGRSVTRSRAAPLAGVVFVWGAAATPVCGPFFSKKNFQDIFMSGILRLSMGNIAAQPASGGQ